MNPVIKDIWLTRLAVTIWLIVFIAFFALLTHLAFGVIQGGVLTFDPVPGATSYRLWRVLPGQTRFEYVASFTTNRYAVSGPIAEGTAFYIKAVTPSADGQFHVESDFGFVVTPPETQGTNVLRFEGPPTAFKLQSASTAAGPWVDIGIYTGTPLQLQLKRAEFLRSITVTNPPMPSAGGPP